MSTDIEEIVPQRAIKTVTDTNAAIETLVGTVKELVAASRGLDDLFGGVGTGKTFKDTAKAMQEAVVVNGKLVTSSKMYVQVVEEQTAAQKKLEASYKSLAISQSAEAKEITEVTQKRNALNYSLKQEVKLNQEATGSIASLKAMLALARIEYDKLDANVRDNTAAGQAQLLNIQRVTNELKRLEERMGVHGRSVGHYGKAFDGLGMSMSQIVREAPAFANSFTTGIMAISNNFPILLDEINKLKAANIELAASGQKTVPIWKSIGKALLSWQTAIIAGITVLAVYGKDIMAFFKGTSVASEKAEKATKKYADAIESAGTSARSTANEEIARLRVLESVATDTTKSMKSRKMATDEMQKLYPSYLGNLKDEVILNGNAATSIDEVTEALLARAAATAAEKRFAASSEKIYDLQLAQRTAVAELAKAEGKLFKARETATISPGSMSMASTGTSPMVGSLELQAGMARKAVEDIAKSIEDEKKVRMQYLTDAKAAGAEAFDLTKPEKEKKEKKDKEKKNIEDISKIQFDAQADALKAEMDNAKAIADNDEASYETRTAALNEYFKLKKRLIEETAAYEKMVGNKSTIEIEAIEQGKQAELLKLSQEVLDIEAGASMDSLKRDREATDQKKANLQSLTEYAAQQWEKQLTKEKQIEAERRILREKAVALGQQAADTLITISNGKADSAIAALDREASAEDRKLEREVARIERSTMTAEQKEEAILQAETKSDEERRKIEERRVEQEKRRANFEKTMALAKIALSTYMAVAKELETKGTAGIITAGVATAFLGGILSAAAAVAIPAYAEGTDNHPGGLAWLGDGGEKELVNLPGGKSFLSSDTAQLYNLPANTSVTPMSDMINESNGLLTPRLLNSIMLASGGNTARMERMLSDKLDEVKGAINKKPVSSVNFSDGFMQKTTVRGNVKTTQLRKNITS